MPLFAATREAGSGWTDGVGAFEQPGIADHAGFMEGLAAEGLVLFAGPLAGSEADRIRVLVIAEAADGAELRARFAADPWEGTQQLETTTIEPWTLMVGADRLSG